MSADGVPAALSRLVGQHPAALRRVRWVGPAPGQASPDYLEIETKHGRVAVIDPATGNATANPPLPPEVPADAVRVVEDLTDQVPAAFDGRPVLTGVWKPAGAAGTCRLRLSTGIDLTLTAKSAVPVVSGLETRVAPPGASS